MIRKAAAVALFAGGCVSPAQHPMGVSMSVQGGGQQIHLDLTSQAVDPTAPLAHGRQQETPEDELRAILAPMVANAIQAALTPEQPSEEEEPES
jgi:hypothetical protein